MTLTGMANSYQYLFGPVPSRRLGRSLGDSVPMSEVLAELERGKVAELGRARSPSALAGPAGRPCR